ncbi:hypothetical protein AB1A81_15180 [Bdellovibrio bacteriovorus]|uniref:Uncharacterized protein n=1 Tax=Bdellovibrio bacteriovorus (strain ATCC 15356 / DSM 50701 / NCIMB 9529 / HD100) TaxID=264462 RepID=Q6MI62_BDEBA|nr:hypothetical protein [Bdellovibrio bacteriovorus]AHZ83680.1 hypothetical protein EP01_01780 [Bdellovibrio bacteriovorus]BEV69652.1 hypothetical protein Bb109J_c3072 [Bdellovibrio bacteriovorus]CAE78118.1 hypothetical protein predicted by Glimmer/Critica [Bdellovibrio bacteriovorus HD100]
MEKISGILPATARTRAVDTSASQPARPGALALGRPMGKNSLGDRITLSKQMEEMRATGNLPEQQMQPEASPVYKRPAGETNKLKVIEDLNQKFFNNPKSVAREGDQTKSEETFTKATENEGLFFVEKDLRAPEQAPLKPQTDTTKVVA